MPGSVKISYHCTNLGCPRSRIYPTKNFKTTEELLEIVKEAADKPKITKCPEKGCKGKAKQEILIRNIP